MGPHLDPDPRRVQVLKPLSVRGHGFRRPELGRSRGTAQTASPSTANSIHTARGRQRANNGKLSDLWQSWRQRPQRQPLQETNQHPVAPQCSPGNHGGQRSACAGEGVYAMYTQPVQARTPEVALTSRTPLIAHQSRCAMSASPTRHGCFLATGSSPPRRSPYC